MQTPSVRRIVWIGGLASLVFSIVLHLSMLWEVPPLNMALWDGSFLTINMGWATFLGLGLEWLIGCLLCLAFAELWAPNVRGSYAFKGSTFGVLWWGFMMILGFPLLGLASPLSRNGLAPYPGLFALGEGPATPILFLLAMVGFGLVAGFFLEQRGHIWGPFHWHLS